MYLNREEDNSKGKETDPGGGDNCHSLAKERPDSLKVFFFSSIFNFILNVNPPEPPLLFEASLNVTLNRASSPGDVW